MFRGQQVRDIFGLGLAISGCCLVQFNKYQYRIIQQLMSCTAGRKKKITKHYFRMVGNIDLYYKSEVLVDFKPLRKKKDVVNRSILPTFTNDRKYFTSSFTLPSEKMESDQQLIQDHQRRVRELGAEIDDILVPKPRSKSKYCGVCRGHYQDYKQHIESDLHVMTLRQSNYQAMIHKFCNRFQSRLKMNEAQEVKNMQFTTCEEIEAKNMDNLLLKTATKVNQ